MSEDRPWDGPDPPGRPDLSFPPIPTAVAVFFAVAAPIVFGGIAVGVRRDGDPRVPLMVIGVLVGIGAGIVTFLALARARDRRDRRQRP